MPLFLVSVEASTPSQDWIQPDDLTDCSSDADTRSAAAAMASAILFSLSGSRFGIETKTLRPYELTGCGSYRWPYTSCGRVCSKIRLPAPATINAITVDGVALAETDYRLYDNQELVRVGNECWPCCQDLKLADTEEGTWSIEAVFGEYVPVGGQAAAKMLACELAKAIDGDSACKLPQRLQSVSRQGVTMAVLDSLDYLDKKRTGLGSVDLWLASINPNGHQTRTRTWNPDDIQYPIET